VRGIEGKNGLKTAIGIGDAPLEPED